MIPSFVVAEIYVRNTSTHVINLSILMLFELPLLRGVFQTQPDDLFAHIEDN